MSNIPSELKYTKSHEWLRRMDDGTVRIGISDNAQSQLGDLVYVELPEVGQTVSAEDACAVVESVKAASDVYAPITGEIVAVNEELDASPELVNQSPYDDGWLFAIAPDAESEIDTLMDADDYAESIDD